MNSMQIVVSISKDKISLTASVAAPTFNVSIQEWESYFIDSYRTMFHNNTCLKTLHCTAMDLLG